MSIGSALVVGGYGLAGSRIARLLLRETPATVTVGGRDLDRATELAERLNQERRGGRARGTRVDVLDPSSVESALDACDLVVDCVPVNTGANTAIARAAYRSGREYANLNIGKAGMQEIAAVCEAEPRPNHHLLIHCGVFPGLPSVLTRLAARSFDTLERVVIAMAGSARATEVSTSSLEEMVSADIKAPSAFRNGAWHGASLSASRKVDFGPPFGLRRCYLCNLDEMEALPGTLRIGECELYAAETNTFLMVVVAAWNALGLNNGRRGIRVGARLLGWGVRRFAKEPFGLTLKLEARGRIRGVGRRLEMHLRFDGVYEATAVCAVGAILQLMDGVVTTPGASYMGHVVDTDRLMRDMQRLGMTVKTAWQ